MEDGVGIMLMHVFLFLVALSLYIFIKRNRTNTAKLPPGSLGWPYIGETLQLYSQDPNVFFANKQKRYVHMFVNLISLINNTFSLIVIWFQLVLRYGEIFKTHILGCPSIMLASPEAARFVLVNQAHLFKPTYPKSKENLIGPLALFFHQGEYHTRLRKLVQGSLSLDNLRRLVPDIEDIAVFALESWAGGQVINTFHEMKKVCFFVRFSSYVIFHLD